MDILVILEFLFSMKSSSSCYLLVLQFLFQQAKHLNVWRSQFSSPSTINRRLGLTPVARILILGTSPATIRTGISYAVLHVLCPLRRGILLSFGIKHGGRQCLSLRSNLYLVYEHAKICLLQQRAYGEHRERIIMSKTTHELESNYRSEKSLKLSIDYTVSS